MASERRAPSAWHVIRAIARREIGIALRRRLVRLLFLGSLVPPLVFGIILVVFVELGQISPPIGINLYVVQAMWSGKLSDVVLGTIPFHLIMLVLLIMLVAWPEIALWLPSRMIQ